jgi:hypothetical protein
MNNKLSSNGKKESEERRNLQAAAALTGIERKGFCSQIDIALPFLAAIIPSLLFCGPDWPPARET